MAIAIAVAVAVSAPMFCLSIEFVFVLLRISNCYNKMDKLQLSDSN